MGQKRFKVRNIPESTTPPTIASEIAFRIVPTIAHRKFLATEFRENRDRRLVRFVPIP